MNRILSIAVSMCFFTVATVVAAPPGRDAAVAESQVLQLTQSSFLHLLSGDSEEAVRLAQQASQKARTELPAGFWLQDVAERSLKDALSIDSLAGDEWNAYYDTIVLACEAKGLARKAESANRAVELLVPALNRLPHHLRGTVAEFWCRTVLGEAYTTLSLHEAAFLERWQALSIVLHTYGEDATIVADLRFVVADSAVKTHRLEEAIHICDRALAIERNRPVRNDRAYPFLYALGNAHYCQERFDSARDILWRIAAHSDDWLTGSESRMLALGVALTVDIENGYYENVLLHASDRSRRLTTKEMAVSLDRQWVTRLQVKALTRTGRYAEAKSLISQLCDVELIEATLNSGGNCLTVTNPIMCISSLAELRLTTGDLESAKRAWSYLWTHFPANFRTPWFPEINGEVEQLSLYALTLHKLREYPAAEEQYGRALELAKKCYDAERSVAYARPADGLGDLLTDLGRLPEAERWITLALDNRRRKLRPDHPDIALSLYHLGRLRAAQGRHVEAEQSFNAAIPIYLTTFESFHPSIRDCRGALATTLDALGRADAAAAQRALVERLAEEHAAREARVREDLARQHQHPGPAPTAPPDVWTRYSSIR